MTPSQEKFILQRSMEVCYHLIDGKGVVRINSLEKNCILVDQESLEFQEDETESIEGTDDPLKLLINKWEC